jgi:putative transposase
MRPPQYILTPQQVQAHAASLLHRHLRLRDYGRTATVARVLHVLFAAAAWLTSIHDACRRLRGAPCDETLRQALFATLPDYQELQRRLNRALVADLPKALRRRRRKLAVDLTLIPYHGAPQERAAEIYRGRPKAGTSHFHAYATAYIPHKGRRYTVALTGVLAGDPLADVVRRLLRQASRAGIRPRLVLLDREFGIGPVVRYLRAARYPFVVGLRRRGRRPEHPKGASGTWALCQQQSRSGWATYTWQEKAGPRVTLAVCVVYRWRRDRRAGGGSGRWSCTAAGGCGGYPPGGCARSTAAASASRRVTGS